MTILTVGFQNGCGPTGPGEDASDAGGSESTSSAAGTAEAAMDGPTGSEDETGTSADSIGGSPAGEQPEVCAQMFRCLAEVAPTVAPPLLELYGESGTCWTFNEEERGICELACIDQLEQLWQSGLYEETHCSSPDGWMPSGGPPGPENSNATCSDQTDNDGNGFVDCDDLACSQNSRVTVCDAPDAPEEDDDSTCSDGVDNDGDSFFDCDDFDCNMNPAVSVCR